MPSGADASCFINGGKTSDGGEIVGMYHWTDKDFDEPIEKLKKKIYSKGYNGVCFIEHTWKQLKKDNAWYEKQCRLLNYQKEVIAREIDLKRLRGSNQSPFSPKDLFYLSTHMKEPIETIKIDGFDLYPKFELYEKLNKSYHYIISVDPSEGLGQDNNAIVVINPYTQLVAAEWECPYMSQPDMCRMLVKFMDKYCRKAMIIVENNKGRDLLNRLAETKYKHNVYYDPDKLGSVMVSMVNEYGAEIENNVRMRKAAGVNTSQKNRPLYYAILEAMVVDEKQKLYSKRLVTSILGLIRKTSGKIEAGPGNHDDMVMAYFMALYVYYNAKNLEDYGIIRGQRAPVDKTDPQYIKEQMKALLAAMPKEMRKDYQDLITPTEDEEKRAYYKEVEQARRLNLIRDKELGDCTAEEVEELGYGGSMYDDDSETIQNFIDEKIYENTHRHNQYQDPYNGYQGGGYGGGGYSPSNDADWWDD